MRLVGQGQTKMWGVRQLGSGKLKTPRRSGGSGTGTRTPEGVAAVERADRATAGRGSASTTQGGWNEKKVNIRQERAEGEEGRNTRSATYQHNRSSSTRRSH